MKEGEELEYDASAYQMLHRSKCEWSCMTVDWLIKDRCAFGGVHDQKTWFPQYANGKLQPDQTIMDRFNLPKHRNDKFPMTTYMVAGS